MPEEVAAKGSILGSEYCRRTKYSNSIFPSGAISRLHPTDASCESADVQQVGVGGRVTR